MAHVQRLENRELMAGDVGLSYGVLENRPHQTNFNNGR